MTILSEIGLVSMDSTNNFPEYMLYSLSFLIVLQETVMQRIKA